MDDDQTKRAGRRLAVLPALLLALSACGGSSDSPDQAEDAGPDTFDVSGVLRLTTYDGVNYVNRGKAGEGCWGESGYDDIAGGAQVVVRDSKGAQVGLGRLEDGVLPENFGQAYTCEFAFSVPDVPEGEGLFTVEVSHRGQVTFERDSADALVLTLG